MSVNERIMVLDGGRKVLLPAFCKSPSGSLDFEQVKMVLASDRFSVLVTGETGCGKEVMADCAFHLTKLAKGRCQKVNCAGLDRNLIGSELFGHKKGAFTGAESDRPGLLKECDGGILFLDEIGWLPPDLQARLLRFMETGEIRPLGSDKLAGHSRVRIIAATNKDVNSDETILHDLRHRFDFEFSLPPLRERGEDIFWFLCEPAFLGAEDVFTGVTLRTFFAIGSQQWKGNVRELKKYCQRKVLFRPSEAIYEGELRYVLDDVGVLTPKDFIALHDFADFALRIVELRMKKGDGYCLEADAWRGIAFLAALHDSFDRLTAAGWPCSHGPIIPLQVLRDLFDGTLVGVGAFDFLPLAELLKEEHKDLDFTVQVCTKGVDDPDFFWAFRLIREVIEGASAFQNDKMMTLAIEEIGGSIVRKTLGPSKEFLDGFQRGPLVGVIFLNPGTPSGTASIETVLDRLGVKGPDREFCVSYRNGASCEDISESMGVGLSTVKDHLAELRRKHTELAPFLTKKAPGRKANK